MIVNTRIVPVHPRFIAMRWDRFKAAASRDATKQ